MSLERTVKGRRLWTMLWKAPLNAFQSVFEDRLTRTIHRHINNQDQPLIDTPKAVLWLWAVSFVSCDRSWS
jgi:hypothetical protein